MKFLLLLLVCFGCCGVNNKSHYTYAGVTVTRIDECDRTIFYYGNGADRTNSIWVEYSGINDGFSGYLAFSKTGRVTLYSGDGYFQVQNPADSIFVLKRVLAFSAPTVGDSVCAIDLSTRYEEERNVKAKSSVRIRYNRN